tara:strand:+ start:120 stop:410 length:291 start_codon:yes stop_codon:yes gene_type:complete
MGYGIAIKGFGKALMKTPKTKSDFKLKNTLKRIQKMPDKKFKNQNPETEKKVSDRTGYVHYERKTSPVKGSLGKKTYKSDVKIGHQAHKRMGLIKD